MQKLLLHSVVLLSALTVFLALPACGNSKDVVNAEDPVGTPGPDAKFKEAFHEALLEKTIGHYDKAIPLFEKCLNLNPNHSASHYALSDLHELKGDIGKAVEHAEKAYALDNSNRWYCMRLAELNFGLSNFKRSAEYYDKVIQDEKNIDVKYQYAEALIYSGQPQKAIDMLDEIEVETGKSPEVALTKHDLYVELGDFEAAEKELQNLIEENPKNLENYLFIADYFLNTNNPSKAEEVLEKAMKVDSNSGDLRVMLADIRLRNNDVKGAFENLKAAFESGDLLLDRKIELTWGLTQFAFNPSNPDKKEMQKQVGELFEMMYDEEAKNADLHNKYAVFLMNLGEKEKARRQFELATTLNPDSFYAWRELMNLDYEMQDFEKMKQHAAKATELFPAQPIFYLLSGIALYHVEDYESSFETLFLGKDMVVSDPELVSEFYYHMGKLHCLQGNMDEGFGYFQSALNEWKENGKVYNEKTIFLLKDGKAEEAESEVQMGLEKLPDHPALLDAQGLIQMHRKEYSKAVTSFSRALENDISNPDIMEHYGDALFLSGKKDEAVEIWKNAVFYGAKSELLNRKIADKQYYEK